MNTKLITYKVIINNADETRHDTLALARAYVRSLYNVLLVRNESSRIDIIKEVIENKHISTTETEKNKIGTLTEIFEGETK